MNDIIYNYKRLKFSICYFQLDWMFWMVRASQYQTSRIFCFVKQRNIYSP